MAFSGGLKYIALDAYNITRVPHLIDMQSC